jgi:hypothetical protein
MGHTIRILGTVAGISAETGLSKVTELHWLRPSDAKPEGRHLRPGRRQLVLPLTTTISSGLRPSSLVYPKRGLPPQAAEAPALFSLTRSEATA